MPYLRYLERGETWVLFLFTAVNMLHFTDKATSYMFAAEEFLFLAAYFVDRVSRRDMAVGNDGGILPARTGPERGIACWCGRILSHSISQLPIHLQSRSG